MSLTSKWVQGIPIPSAFPEELRKAIDLDGNNRIDFGTEAQNAYETVQNLQGILTGRGPLNVEEKGALNKVRKTLPVINPETQSFQVYGYQMKVQGDRPLTEGELFNIAEALRSYGPYMMKRVVEGEGRERPLRIFVGELESFLGAEILSLHLSRQAFWGAGEFIHHYFPEDNVLFLNTANQAAFGSFKGKNSDLKATVRHELGHIVSDFAYEGVFWGRFEWVSRSLHDVAHQIGLIDKWLTYSAPHPEIAREFREGAREGDLEDRIRSRFFELGDVIQRRARFLERVSPSVRKEWDKESTARHIFLGWWEFFAEMGRSFVTSDAEIQTGDDSTFVWKVDESIGRSLECYLDGKSAEDCFGLRDIPPSWMLSGPISASF